MSAASNKKAQERAILRKVYDPKAFKSVRKSERPDFVLRREGSTPFGVEVTRLYDSESAARLDEIEGYSLELIDGGEHRHKDDVEALPVKDITIEEPDGTVHAAVKAVMYSLSPLPNHIQMIAARIEAKAEIAKSSPKLSHVNLIIQDTTGRFVAMPPEKVTSVIFTADLRKVLAATPFREVFYLTAVHDKRNVYFPLRMLLLVSEFFLFNDSRIGYAKEDVESHSWGEELTLFGSFLRSRGIPVALALAANDLGVQVILGNSGVLVVNNGVTVRNYADRPLPPTWIPPDHKFEDDFLTYCDKFAAEHVFNTGIVFDARKK